jgi:hypothetical protein
MVIGRSGNAKAGAAAKAVNPMATAVPVRMNQFVRVIMYALRQLCGFDNVDASMP